MKSTAYRKHLAQSRETTGVVYYGWPFRDAIKAIDSPPEKFALGRVLPWCLPLAMFAALGVAALTDGPMRLGAALSVLGIGLAIPVVSRMPR